MKMFSKVHFLLFAVVGQESGKEENRERGQITRPRCELLCFAACHAWSYCTVSFWSARLFL